MHAEDKAWPSTCWIDRVHLTRLVANIIAQEVASNRRLDLQRLRPDTWDDAYGILDTGLALDSLERMNCAAALNEFFHLSEFGAEDYLLAAETLGDWVYIVALSIASGAAQLTFRTSGSTGAAKSCTHALDMLHAEISVWAAMFETRTHIVSLVPPQHLFGFVFTVVLAQALKRPVQDMRFASAATLKRALQKPGALLVAAPVSWQFLARSIPAFPADVHGVSSAALMPAELATQLKEQGLAALLDVYGSSETGGIGFRCAPDTPYSLLPHWMLETSGDDASLINLKTGAETALMDVVSPGPENTFALHKRRDGAVQVGGVNVFPDYVARVVTGFPDVAQCAVRYCAERARLKAFVVPHNRADDHSTLEQRLRQLCAQHLNTPERPSAFMFGQALPVNALGKASDW